MAAASSCSGGESGEDLCGEGEFRMLLCRDRGDRPKVIETNTRCFDAASENLMAKQIE